MRSNAAILFSLIVIAGGACGKKEAPQAASQQTVLARVGKGVVTTKDLLDANEGVSSLDREMRDLTPEQRKRKLFDELVQKEAGVQEAYRRGLDRDPDIRKAIDKLLLNRLISDEILNKVKPDDVPEDQVQAYYKEHVSEFTNEDEVRVSAIYTRDEAGAKKAAALAKAARSKNWDEDRKGFRDLVRIYRDTSNTPGRDRSGDLSFFDRKSIRYAPEMIAAAFELKEIGEVAGPIKTQSGYYIIKLVEQRPAATRPLEQLKTMIRQRLVRQVREARSQQLLGDLVKKQNPQIDEKALKAVELPSRR
jgi:peptidyl-prolyl cis-trans isomerase C